MHIITPTALSRHRDDLFPPRHSLHIDTFVSSVTVAQDISQTLDFNVRGRIIRSIELNTSHQFRWNLRWPDVQGMDRFGVVSNISLGYIFGEQKNFTLQLEGNDLFNRKQRITVDTNADYISTSYVRKIGRCIMLRAEWKF